MKGYFTLKNILAVLVVVLLAVQAITWVQLNQTRREVQDAAGDRLLILNELDNAIQQNSMSAIPGTNRLYLPELKITVPLNTASRSVRYTYDTYGASTDKSGDLRVTTTYMTDHTTHTKSCADMVRLKIEPTPDAYSPGQPLYATVKLADGRTLQIYASNTKECAKAWVPMPPQTLAAPFKEAQTVSTS